VERLKQSIITGTWDKPVYLVGGGTSLASFDFSKICGKGIIVGLNNSAFNTESDCLVTLDQHFVRMRRDQIAEYARKKETILVMPLAENQHKHIPEATYIERIRGDRLSGQPHQIAGVHTGFAAMNLAYLKKAKKIYMLGYDMHIGKNATHWHGGYPWHSAVNHKYFDRFARGFEEAALQFEEAGTEVINVIGDNDSLIQTFPKIHLNEL
jgi:hypothetical protein